MNLVREKVSQSDTPKQLQLLTLAPQSCSRETVSEYFGVSVHLVRESRKLFKKTSIFREVGSKRGRLLQ